MHHVLRRDLGHVRLADKRPIGKHTAFDVVLAVMLGSVASRAVTDGTTALGWISAALALVLLHLTLSKLSFHSDWFGTLVEGSPRVLVRDGEIQWEAMAKAAITENDLRGMLRSGTSSPDLERVEVANLGRSGEVDDRPSRSCGRCHTDGMGDGRPEDLRARPPEVVFADHLRVANAQRFEQDLERNYSPECVVLERRGVFRGHEGVRQLAAYLFDELGDARYEYVIQMVEGSIAFLEWTSDGPLARVADGADSYVIENGWIVAQTIHYTVQAK